MLTAPEGDQIPSQEPLVLAAAPGIMAGPRLGTRGLAAGVLLALGIYTVMLATSGMYAATGPVIAVFLCSLLAGVVGFAFSAIGQPVLAELMRSPVHIVQTLMLCSLANQAFSIASLWRHMQWTRLPPFLIGGMLGLPIGVYGLLHLAPREFHIAVGTIILLYGAYVLVRRPIVLPDMGAFVDGAVGFLGGIIGGLSAFPGAPVTIWCSLKGWNKSQQRGVFQPYILVMQVIGLVLLTTLSARGSHAGLLAVGGVMTTIAVVPSSLAGTWFGLRIFHKISDRGFEACMAVLLMVSGVLLLA